jgi:hypothetical protein
LWGRCLCGDAAFVGMTGCREVDFQSVKHEHSRGLFQQFL